MTHSREEKILQAAQEAVEKYGEAMKHLAEDKSWWERSYLLPAFDEECVPAAWVPALLEESMRRDRKELVREIERMEDKDACGFYCDCGEDHFDGAKQQIIALLKK